MKDKDKVMEKDKDKGKKQGLRKGVG